jgi:hypothetical protein
LRERATTHKGEGLTHLGRLTLNLLRPAPIGECRIEVARDHLSRNAGHVAAPDRESQGNRPLHGA